MKNILLSLLFLPILSIASESHEIDNCVIKNGSSSETDILKIVSVQGNEYITYSYFLTDGALVQGKDYIKKIKSLVDENYSIVICPKHDSIFSPEKYLDKNS